MGILSCSNRDAKFGLYKCFHVNQLTGGINPANATDILLKTIIYCKARGNKPFYKYINKPQAGAIGYVEGDSWAEELVIGFRAVETALEKIATKISKGASLKEITKTKTAKTLVFYYRGSNNLTYYFVNPFYAPVLFDDTLKVNIFKNADGSLRTQQQIMNALYALGKEFEDSGKINSYDKVTKKEMGKSRAAKSKKPDITVTVDGEEVEARLIVARKSDPSLRVPRLEEHIRMHEDFEPTEVMINYALEKGWTKERIDALTVNQINYYSSVNVKRPGFWETWHDNFLKWNSNYGKNEPRLTASEKQAQLFRELAAETDAYDKYIR